MSELIDDFFFYLFNRMSPLMVIILLVLMDVVAGAAFSTTSENTQNAIGLTMSVGVFIPFLTIFYYKRYSRRVYDRALELALQDDTINEESFIIEDATPEEIQENIQYIRSLLDSFKPVTNVRNFNESTLEGQLVQYLQVYYGAERIRYQHTTSEGRVDIVIDGRYGIELKLSSSKKQLETAYYQFYKYAGVLDYLFVVIYDKERRLQESELTRIREDLAHNNRANVSFILTHKH